MLAKRKKDMTWSNHTHSLSSRINRTRWRWRQNARRTGASAKKFPEMPSNTCAGIVRPQVEKRDDSSPVLPHATGVILQPDTNQAHNLHAVK
jgi:hypothetical protein